MKKTSRRTFIKQSALTAIAVSGAGTFLWSKIGDAQDKKPPSSDATATDAARWDTVKGGRIPAESNQVPYIATYYVQPKTVVGEDVTISYYVTDFYQKEYMQDDPSERFTVEYWINGEKSVLRDVKAGDNSFIVKGLAEGKILLALQATDAKGRKSHRLFQEFLVVDPKEEEIPEDKVLHPDLNKFGIFHDDSHPVETTSGLTAMLKWASDNAYRKVVLPKGRYRLDENSTVFMATKLTLDLNGSTFKLNPSGVKDVVMFDMINCFDSHVINGIFEGDWEERKTAKLPLSEHVRGVAMGQDSQYCSYQDIKVVDITGYGTVTMIGGRGVKSFAKSHIGTLKFAPGDVDAQGKVIASDVRMNSEKLTDISSFVEAFGFFQLGRYLGYMGNPASSYVYMAHFYDADQKYLETIEGFMYRRTYIPRNAKFVRVTLLGVDTPELLAKYRLIVFDMRAPYNCTFRNVQHENVRCVGMVPSGFNNLLVEACRFENCGLNGARSGFDAEDGWDQMQDLTFRGNTFGENQHNDFTTVSGHNFVVENNTMQLNVVGIKSIALRHNQIKGGTISFKRYKSTGYPRISHNVVKGYIRLMSRVNIERGEYYREFCIRDNECLGGVSTVRSRGTGADLGYCYACTISGGPATAKLVKCKVEGLLNPDEKNVRGSFEIYESEVKNSFLGSGMNQSSLIVNSVISGSKIGTQGGSVLLQNNKIQDTECFSPSTVIEGNEYILRENKIITSLDHLVAMGRSYKQVVLEKNIITSTNPHFSAIQLEGLVSPNDATVTITQSTFNGKGRFVINMTSAPVGKCMLTAYFFENKYNGIEEISKNALDFAGVTIVRAKPAAGTA